MAENQVWSIRLTDARMLAAIEVYRRNLSLKSKVAAVEDILRDRLVDLGYLSTIDKANKI